MSAFLLENPEKIHRLQDDVESFFWVLLYHASRYLKNSIPVEKLDSMMKRIFDQVDPSFPGREDTGGMGKRNLISSLVPEAYGFFSHQQRATDDAHLYYFQHVVFLV